MSTDNAVSKGGTVIKKDTENNFKTTLQQKHSACGMFL
jgi:hypothetical protein